MRGLLEQYRVCERLYVSLDYKSSNRGIKVTGGRTKG